MRKNYKILFAALITALVLFFIVFTAISLGNMLIILLISVILTYILLPLHETLQKLMPKALSALVIILLLISTIFLTLYWILPVIFNQLKELVQQIPELLNTITEKSDIIFRWLSKFGINISAEEIIENNNGTINNTITSFAQGILSFALDFTSSLPAIVTIPVLIFYFLKDKNYFVNTIGYIIPLNTRKKINPILNDLNSSLKQYIRAQFVIMLLVGITSIIGYFIIDIPYAIVLGVFMGLSEMIPYFGPIVGAIPACLVVLMYDPSKIIITIFVVIIVQQIENHLLTPYVMGNTTNIHPVIVILILWVASYFFSFFGFLLGVPLFIILREFCKFFYRTLVKAEKENAY